MTTDQNLHIAFNNGIFEAVSDLKVKIDSLTVNRAYAAYEFLRVKNGQPFCLDRHLDRLFRTLELMRLSISYQRIDIEQIIAEMINKNDGKDFYLKLFAVSESSNLLLNPASLSISPFVFKDYPEELYQNGARLIMKEYSRFLPEAKTTNYVASAYWQYEMDQANAVDVLYISGNEIFETSRGNIFIAKGNTIYTPDKNILKGITRSIVLDLVREIQPVNEQALSVRDLYWADEVFVTSTTKRIMPIVKIGRSEIGNGKVGEVSKAILALYDQKLKHGS